MADTAKLTGRCWVQVSGLAIALTTADVIEQFLAEKAKEMPTRKRLIFAIDATASRQRTWDQAAQVQGQMFLEAGRHGGLEIQLVYYRGFDEMKATRWFASSKPLVEAMSGVICRAGNTQIGRVLRHAVKERPDAMVLIGDHCEEHLTDLQPLAAELGRLQVPAFCFLEGHSSEGKETFEMIAGLTRGALLELNAHSAANLRELLGAVAAYVAGGPAALVNQRPEVVRLLTHGGSDA
jgi:hypothetical protein